MSTEATAEQETPEEETDAATLDEDDEIEPVDVVHAPPRLTQGVAIVAAFFGAVLSGAFVPLAIPFNLAGFVMFTASITIRNSSRWLAGGIGLILFGTLFTGAYGVLPPELMILAVGMTLVAGDAGQHGLVLGEQLGRQARSYRTQIVHLAGTVFVIGFSGLLVSAVFLIAGDGRPAPAVVIAVVGILFSAWIFRN